MQNTNVKNWYTLGAETYFFKINITCLIFFITHQKLQKQVSFWHTLQDTYHFSVRYTCMKAFDIVSVHPFIHALPEDVAACVSRQLRSGSGHDVALLKPHINHTLHSHRGRDSE